MLMNSDLSGLVDPENGALITRSRRRAAQRWRRRYPVVAGIPRFVPADNYARDFGKAMELDSRRPSSIRTPGCASPEDRLARCLRGVSPGSPASGSSKPGRVQSASPRSCSATRPSIRSTTLMLSRPTLLTTAAIRC